MYPDPANPKSDPILLQRVDYDPFQLMSVVLPDHPRVSITKARIARARARLDAREPIDTTCYVTFLSHCHLATPLPPFIPDRDDRDVSFTSVAADALHNALAFHLNGDTAHRCRALTAMRLTADAFPRRAWSGFESGVFGMLASTYDYLAATGLSGADDTLFRAMLLGILPALEGCGHRRCNNHNAWNQLNRLAVGVALGMPEPIHDALYGLQRNGTWRYGLIHNLRHDFLADGMQWEGSLSYHMVVLCAVAEAATILENCGVDLWHKELSALMQSDGHDEHRGYGPRGLKCIKAGFDVFFYQMFPNGDYSLLHDQILANIRGTGAWWPLFPKAYEVYGDPKYAWLLNRMIHDFPAEKGSILPPWFSRADMEFVRLEARQYPDGEFTLSRDAAISLVGRNEGGCSLLPAYGAAILRPEPDKADALAASLYFGPHSAGHRSPAALHMEIHAGGQRITQSPHIYDGGYDDPRHLYWNRATIAHNTVTVDETPMFPFDFETNSPWEWDIWRDTISDGELITFQTQATWKAVRACNVNVYPGVQLDRTLLVTPSYLVDTYRVVGVRPHRYDWAVHCHGEFARPPGADSVALGSKWGYRYFTDAWCATTQPGWIEVPFQIDTIAAHCRIFLPDTAEGSRLMVAKDPLPDKRTPIGDLIAPLPRTTLIVRTHAVQALFLSIWSFDGCPPEPELEKGAADKDIHLAIRSGDRVTRWRLPYDGKIGCRS